MPDATSKSAADATRGRDAAFAQHRRRTIRTIHNLLLSAYGPQHWWPAETALEVVVGAILTQNTAWRNVERAIAALRNGGWLNWAALRDIDVDRLAEVIRPAGTFRVKARRLKAFVDRLWLDHAGRLEKFLAGDLETVRRQLLSIHGIGPETADAILVYAAERPSFVVDAYTKRILRRHGLIPDSVGYEAIRGWFHDALAPDAAMFNEYHALLVEVGKRHCRVRAICDGCPLARLPHDPEL